MAMKSNCKLDDYETSLGKLLTFPESTKICVMVHNAEWPAISRYKSKCMCTINIYGSGVWYLNNHERENFVDYDLMLLYSSKIFDEDEFIDVEEHAMNISRNNNKTVVYGYASLIPHDERQGDESYRVCINKINNGIKDDCENIANIPWSQNCIIQCISLMYDISKEKNPYEVEGQVKGPIELKSKKIYYMITYVHLDLLENM